MKSDPLDQRRDREPLALEPANVAVLTALAVATPLCELLRRAPEFLWVHGVGPGRLVGLVAALLVLPALPLVAVAAAGAWAARSRRPVVASSATGFAIATPVVLIGLQLAVRLGVGGWRAIVPAVVAGLSLAILYRRLRGIRRFVTLLALVALVAPLRLLVAGEGLEAVPGAPELELGRTGSEAPIVFVVFDELPMLSVLGEGDAWDETNFPNFARLAAVSHAFLNTHAAFTSTLRAVPEIVTGRRVTSAKPPTAANYPRNLFTLLGGDHEIWAFESATRLCPPELNRRRSGDEEQPDLVSDLEILWLTLTVPEPWAESLPPVDMTWGDFAGRAFETIDVESWEDPSGASDFETQYKQARARIRATRAQRHFYFREFIRAAAGGKPRSLHFIHTMLPHAPFLFLPQGKLYDDGSRARPGGLSETWSAEDPEIVALAYQRHLLQTRFVDRLLGELLDGLEASGSFERAVIVVTADHGASFRPGEPPRDSRGSNPDETLWVPLLIKQPGQRVGQRHYQRVEARAILPTLLDLLEAPSPWALEAESARASAGAAGPEALPEAAEARRWKEGLFGSPPSFEPPLGINRHADLVGVELAELEVRRSNRFELRRIDPAGSLDYDPDRSIVPTWVTGRLVDRRDGGESESECCDLAFAVGGRVVGVQRTYTGGPVAERFQVLLPESALREGSNELRILVVDTTGPTRVLLEPRFRRRR